MTEIVLNVTVLVTTALQVTSEAELTGGQSKDVNCVVVKFAVYTIITGLLCLFGIVGNTLSFMVLAKDKSNRVASFLLQGLAVADNLLLLLAFIILSCMSGLLPFLNLNSLWNTMVPFMLKYLQPLVYMAQTLTIWFTVLLAINRYIAVCRPFDASSWCCMKYTRLQVGGIILFSIAYNIPRFFQYQIDYHANGTIDVMEDPHMGVNTLFGITYTTALYTIIVLLTPFALILFMNTCIILELRAVRKRGQFMSAQPILSDYNITLIMVIIIVVFLVCHAPERVLNVIKCVHTPAKEDKVCDDGHFYYQLICNILVIINSGVNFIVYCVFRKRFRRILLSLTCMELFSVSKSSYAEGSKPLRIVAKDTAPKAKEVEL